MRVSSVSRPGQEDCGPGLRAPPSSYRARRPTKSFGERHLSRVIFHCERVAERRGPSTRYLFVWEFHIHIDCVSLVHEYQQSGPSVGRVVEPTLGVESLIHTVNPGRNKEGALVDGQKRLHPEALPEVASPSKEKDNTA